MITIQEFLKKINTGNIVRSSIPMGLGAGLPMIDIRGERLLVSVFYYRAVLRPEDKTLIMPPEYGLTVEYPGMQLVNFQDFRMDPRFAGTSFDKPVGTFRHKEIMHLNRGEYKACKERLYGLINKLIAYLGDEGEFDEKDEKELSEIFTMLAEPSLLPVYRLMAPQFCQRFVRK